MNRQKRFLTADWNNVLMLNYAVDPSLLQRFVPEGTELGLFEGKTYLSLVGFEFNRLRIFGLAIPFHQSFEEVNLRFYVRRSSRRGVVFIRELVPKFAVVAVARFVFNENYSRVSMSHRVETRPEGGVAEAEYAWGLGQDRCSMRVEIEGESSLPPDGSLGQFITEHYWGYSAQPGGGCLEYEVRHPRWCVSKATRTEFSGNAAGFYGAGIAQALTHEPDSAFFTCGSPVTVFKGTKIS
jgi:uncharacterized protein YqjF (DUF2071 family)